MPNYFTERAVAIAKLHSSSQAECGGLESWRIQGSLHSIGDQEHALRGLEVLEACCDECEVCGPCFCAGLGACEKDDAAYQSIGSSTLANMHAVFANVAEPDWAACDGSNPPLCDCLHALWTEIDLNATGFDLTYQGPIGSRCFWEYSRELNVGACASPLLPPDCYPLKLLIRLAVNHCGYSPPAEEGGYILTVDVTGNVPAPGCTFTQSLFYNTTPTYPYCSAETTTITNAAPNGGTATVTWNTQDFYTPLFFSVKFNSFPVSCSDCTEKLVVDEAIKMLKGEEPYLHYPPYTRNGDKVWRLRNLGGCGFATPLYHIFTKAGWYFYLTMYLEAANPPNFDKTRWQLEAVIRDYRHLKFDPDIPEIKFYCEDDPVFHRFFIGDVETVEYSCDNPPTIGNELTCGTHADHSGGTGPDDFYPCGESGSATLYAGD